MGIGVGGRRWMEAEKLGLGGGRKKGGKLKRFKERGRVGRSGGTRRFRAAVASVMELERTPLNISSRSYQRPREMRYWQELLSALTAEQVNRVGRQATG